MQQLLHRSVWGMLAEVCRSTQLGNQPIHTLLCLLDQVGGQLQSNELLSLTEQKALLSLKERHCNAGNICTTCHSAVDLAVERHAVQLRKRYVHMIIHWQH